MNNQLNIPQPLIQRVIDANGSMPELFLLVDTTAHRLSLVNNGTIQTSYTVSTAERGTGNRKNSMQTPLGVHRVREKIGDAAPAGSIFVDRINTEKTWVEGMADNGNLILSRILRLEGLENGINRGDDVDTFERYIYIHGTNREASIGTPFSHGCICMKNSDVIELFDLIPEKTLVIIT